MTVKQGQNDRILQGRAFRAWMDFKIIRSMQMEHGR